MSARGLKPGSHCARVLEVLADRQPHSITEIHARAGFMRLNSRVAELRKHGHAIVCTRVGDDYIYQLSESEPDTVGREASASSYPVGQGGGSRAESPSAPSSLASSPKLEPDPGLPVRAATGAPLPSGSGSVGAHEQLELGVAA